VDRETKDPVYEVWDPSELMTVIVVSLVWHKRFIILMQLSPGHLFHQQRKLLKLVVPYGGICRHMLDLAIKWTSSFTKACFIWPLDLR